MAVYVAGKSVLPAPIGCYFFGIAHQMLKRVLTLLLAMALCGCTAEDPTALDTDVIMSFDSTGSVDETMDRLEAAVRAQGLTVFARIDHAANAQAAGLDLLPSQVLIFGNPKAGTQLMTINPNIALELPLKALVRAKGEGSVVYMRDPAALAIQYRIKTLDALVRKMRNTLRNLGNSAASPA